MARCNKVVSMRPSAFYVRAALRDCKTVKQARDIALLYVAETERLREWVRSRGMIPPTFKVIETEAEAKGWGSQPDADLPECNDCGDCRG